MTKIIKWEEGMPTETIPIFDDSKQEIIGYALNVEFGSKNKEIYRVTLYQEDIKGIFIGGLNCLGERRDINFWKELATEKLFDENLIEFKFKNLKK